MLDEGQMAYKARGLARVDGPDGGCVAVDEGTV